MRSIISICIVMWCIAGFGLANYVPERVTFSGSRGTLVGTFYPTTTNARAIVFVHMLGRNRGDWNHAARVMQSKGFSVLTYDLYGHGESGVVDQVDWRTFQKQDLEDAVLDVSAAERFVIGKGAQKIGFVGAHLGANLVAQHVARYSNRAEAVTLINPGLQYGVSLDVVERIAVPVYIVTTTTEAQAAMQLIRSKVSGVCKVDSYRQRKHTMFFLQQRSSVIQSISLWLASVII